MVFLFSKTFRPTQVPNPCSLGTANIFLGGYVALVWSSSLTPSSAEVINVWSYTSTFSICLHGMKRNNYRFLYVYFTLRCAVPPTYAIFVKYLLSFISSQSVRLHENHNTSGLAKESVFESVIWECNRYWFRCFMLISVRPHIIFGPSIISTIFDVQGSLHRKYIPIYIQ